MRVFLTGLCGSLATSLTRLHVARGDQVWGCSRNEANACRWLAANGRLATLFVCDAVKLMSSYTDLGRLLPTMDRLYHCAAMKHVDLCEGNPHEAFIQNVDLTSLVSIACLNRGVPMVFISSDKACLPQGVYGATKLLAEREVLRHGGSVVRFGNLIGSSGSVFEIWSKAAQAGEPIRLTDPEMTRYFLPVVEAARFAADGCVAGSVAIPHPMKAVRMGDVANGLAGGNVEITGRRPGETQHQWLVAPGEFVAAMEGGVLLGAGVPQPLGWHSLTAPRWDVGELLRVAGVTLGRAA